MEEKYDNQGHLRHPQDYQVLLSNLESAGSLVDKLNHLGFRAEIYNVANLRQERPSEAQAIRLGVRFLPEDAVRVIKLALQHWPFLSYIHLTDDVDEPPEYVHSQIFIGGSTKAAVKQRRLSAWLAEDFRGLQESMNASELHDYVRKRYGAKYERHIKRRRKGRWLSSRA